MNNLYSYHNSYHTDSAIRWRRRILRRRCRYDIDRCFDCAAVAWWAVINFCKEALSLLPYVALPAVIATTVALSGCQAPTPASVGHQVLHENGFEAMCQRNPNAGTCQR